MPHPNTSASGDRPRGLRVLITGAGSGIGEAAARALDRCGCEVALAGRRRDALEKAARDLSRPALILPTDVGSSESARAAVRACVQRWGGLDALVCSAGVGVVAPIDQTTDDLLDRTYRVNTLAPAWMTLEAWPTFVRQHAERGWGGRIVYVSSMASIDPFPGFFAYAGSKAALNLMALSAHKEGAGVGVRAFAVAPGAVETPMLRASFAEDALPPEQTLEPDFVADVIACCVLGQEDARSGSVIPVLPRAAREWYEQHARDTRLPRAEVGPLYGQTWEPRAGLPGA